MDAAHSRAPSPPGPLPDSREKTFFGFQKALHWSRKSIVISGLDRFCRVGRQRNFGAPAAEWQRNSGLANPSLMTAVAIARRGSCRRLAEDRLGRVGKGIGELPVLHQLADMAIERRANRRELGEMNMPRAGLDPVIGQARHAENPRRRFLGEAQGAPPPPQCRSDAGLRVLRTARRLLARSGAEQPRPDGGTRTRGFRSVLR